MSGVQRVRSLVHVAILPLTQKLIQLVVDFRVEPDPSKAVKLSVTFDSKAPCVVGELLPGKSSYVYQPV